MSEQEDRDDYFDDIRKSDQLPGAGILAVGACGLIAVAVVIGFVLLF